MRCQYGNDGYCGEEATRRLEVDHLRDGLLKRVAGFDDKPGGLFRLYLCGEHFRQEVRDWVSLWDLVGTEVAGG